MSVTVSPGNPAAAARPAVATPRLLWAGAVAGVLYTAIVILGAAATPGYDHVADPVSALYQVGAPHATTIAVAFGLYNLVVVVFALALARVVSVSGPARRLAGLAGSWTLVLTGVAGAIDDIFPQDPIGTTLTTPGTLHVVFAGLASLLTMVAIGLFAAWFLARPRLRGLGWYSLAALAVIFASGGATAVATAGASPIMGLLERFPIFGFVVWMLVVSVAFGSGLAVATKEDVP